MVILVTISRNSLKCLQHSEKNRVTCVKLCDAGQVTTPRTTPRTLARAASGKGHAPPRLGEEEEEEKRNHENVVEATDHCAMRSFGSFDMRRSGVRDAKDIRVE